MSDESNSISDVQRTEASTTRRAAEKAHGAIDAAADRLGEQENRLRDSVQSSSQELRSYILENPLKSVAIVFAAGYLLSTLRR